MGAPSKRAKRVRQAKEFDLDRLAAKLYMPRDGRTTIDAWSVDDILAAREEQMLGQFVRPSRMVEAMRTDDALFTAYHNRLAPQRVIPVEMEPASGARGAKIADEGEALFGANGVGITPETLGNIHGCLVNHGVAFGTNVATPRPDGSRVDFEVHYFPIEYVRWDPLYRLFKARVDPNTLQPGDIPEDPFNQYGWVGGVWAPVIHGDGRWIIFKNYDLEPFREDAAILPAALIWSRHAFAARDWSMGSKAHGSAKVVGELPENVPLQRNGKLSDEAEAFIHLLKAMARADAPAGIRPAGSKTEFLTNNSTAWQVWSELVLNAEKAAARVFLGTDGTMGASGGAPGVDIKELFGVAKTKVRGDCECISRGLDTGVIQPWTAVNFGDSSLAPKRKYILPNDEQEETDKNYADRNAKFYMALKDARASGLTVTPEYVAKLAVDYRVRVPELAGPVVPAPSSGGSGGSSAATVTNTIKKVGSKYVVYSEDGSKKLGEYDTKAEAEKRLRQIEYYKDQ